MCKPKIKIQCTSKFLSVSVILDKAQVSGSHGENGFLVTDMSMIVMFKMYFWPGQPPSLGKYIDLKNELTEKFIRNISSRQR